MNRSAEEIIAELRRRGVHVRQYLADRRYEIWVDGEKATTEYSPIATEQRIRRVLGITNAEGVAVEQAIKRELDKS